MFTIIRRHARGAELHDVRVSAIGRNGQLLATFRSAAGAEAFVAAMRAVTRPQLVR